MLSASQILPQPSASGADVSQKICLGSPTSSTASSPRAKPTVGLTITASATAQTLTVSADNELTNLGWLHKPGVLNSMCTALTGSPHKHSRTGTRIRKPKSSKFPSDGGGGGTKSESVRSRGAKDSDKMVNVILNVRNRKYNGEDAHKPPLSFACMIFMAIESSPTKTLPVKDIYDWIMWKFPYYQCAAGGWKNSIRHNLSLNKCFKKVERLSSSKSKSAVCKGGLWTVDPDYRRSLLAALKRSPYHPYHRYFTPPLSPSSSSSSLEGLDPAERDAALTMCMISGGENGSPPVTSELLQAILHDHCYSKKPPNFIVPAMPRLRRRRTGLTLDEVAAAAEMILAQEDEAAATKEGAGHESSDEGLGGEVDSDCDEDEGRAESGLLGDSGYGGQSMEELGADALLCLAGTSRSNTPPPTS